MWELLKEKIGINYNIYEFEIWKFFLGNRKVLGFLSRGGCVFMFGKFGLFVVSVKWEVKWVGGECIRYFSVWDIYIVEGEESIGFRRFIF